MWFWRNIPSNIPTYTHQPDCTPSRRIFFIEFFSIFVLERFFIHPQVWWIFNDWIILQVRSFSFVCQFTTKICLHFFREFVIIFEIKQFDSSHAIFETFFFLNGYSIPIPKFCSIWTHHLDRTIVSTYIHIFDRDFIILQYLDYLAWKTFTLFYLHL